MIASNRVPRFCCGGCLRLATGWFCGVSTQLHQEVAGFDDVIEPAHSDFRDSGLKSASVIRLGFLTVLPADHFLGVLGSISRERHTRLLQRLAAFLSIERRG